MTLWKVVAGEYTNGILVREGLALASPLCTQRLSFGAWVQEKALIDGQRLHYTLIEGEGPSSGWVSIQLNHKKLLVSSRLVRQISSYSSSFELQLLRASRSRQRQDTFANTPFDNLLSLASCGCGSRLCGIAGLARLTSEPVAVQNHPIPACALEDEQRESSETICDESPSSTSHLSSRMVRRSGSRILVRRPALDEECEEPEVLDVEHELLMTPRNQESPERNPDVDTSFTAELLMTPPGREENDGFGGLADLPSRSPLCKVHRLSVSSRPDLDDDDEHFIEQEYAALDNAKVYRLSVTSRPDLDDEDDDQAIEQEYAALDMTDSHALSLHAVDAGISIEGADKKIKLTDTVDNSIGFTKSRGKDTSRAFSKFSAQLASTEEMSPKKRSAGGA
jgi:hypothetical protein